MRSALITNAVNLLSTLLFQVVLTSYFGVSTDLGRFYFFLTLSMIVVSVVSPAFQNTQLKYLMDGNSINIHVLKRFSRMLLIAFIVQFGITTSYVFMNPVFFDNQRNFSIHFILIIISSLYSLFQFLAALVSMILIALGRFTSAGLLPVIPSLVAATAVFFHQSFLLLTFSITIGSLLQTLLGVYFLRKVQLKNSNVRSGDDENKRSFTLFLAILQYVLLNFATFFQRGVMAGSSLSAYALFSVADKNVAAESALATRGFHQVGISETLKLGVDKERNRRAFFKLVKSLSIILTITTLTFYIFGETVLRFVFVRGNFSSATFSDSLEIMQWMQLFMCIETYVVLFSNYLFNTRYIKDAAIITSLSALSLIFLLFSYKDALTAHTLVCILTVNSLLWFIVRGIYLKRILIFSWKSFFSLCSYLVISVSLPCFYFIGSFRP
jgi:peptidoglycan biosynthesis protein MviN/MurJ (putative lipid II flippase)